MVDQTHQQSGDIADDSSMPSREGSPARVADPSYLKPTSDRTCDIEASEGPVREKLKKTSIASIPRQAGSSGNVEEHEAEANPTIAHVLANDAQAAGDGSSPEATDRGRPARKRSFDDLDMDKATPSDHHEPDIGNQGGRERKRSKDVGASRGPHSDTDEVTLSAIRPPDVVEKGKKAEEDDESTEAKKIPNDMNEELIPASIDTELVDEEMHQSTFSPRKKRSRDQLDADSQREQKIPATEEAKAHRRSEEHERDDKPQEDDDGLPQGRTSAQSGEASTAQKVPQTAGEGIRKSGFRNTSTISPFGQLASSEPASKSSSISGQGASDSSSRKPTNAFGSSASLSGLQSSASPFSTLGPSPSGITKSFGSEPFSGGQNTSSTVGAGRSSGQATTNGLSAPPPTTTAHNANVMAPSPFVAAGGTSSGSSFGGRTFGSGFGQNSGFGAPKLTSFANPGGGDMALGKPSAIKPIGATLGSDDEGSGSEGDEEGDREHDIEKEDTDPRFQHQQMDTGEEGEESKFSSGRAKLYGWEDKAWKERGAGVFRFNLSTSETIDDTQQRQKARFIMRAHQTYRVLLNTPVFKEMMVGDPLRKGEEPTSKSLLIAVVTEEGKAVPKAVPYLIRLNDPGEAKSLYREVRKLQEQL